MAVSAAYIDDVLLVDRCLDGEQAAARELFRRHRTRVHASLYRVLGTNRDMDDLMQEAFLQVFQSLRAWRAEASLATWIDRIAVRCAFRWLRQKRTSLPTVSRISGIQNPISGRTPVVAPGRALAEGGTLRSTPADRPLSPHKSP